MSQELGNKFRELRSRAGYTQKEVASMLGLKNKSTYASWEGGKAEPNSGMFIKLCRVFGLTDFKFFYDLEEVFGNGPGERYNRKEKEIIRKYRGIEDDSRNVVEALLNLEYNRNQEQITHADDLMTQFGMVPSGELPTRHADGV